MFFVDTGDFSVLETLIYNLIELSKTIDDEIAQDAAIDAANFAENLAAHYKQYLVLNTNNDGNPTELYHFETAQMISSRTPSITVNSTKDGFTIIMRGKDVAYQEYGIGDVAEEHPNKPAGYTYGGGPKVLRNGGYANSSFAEDVPQWYLSGIESGKINKNRAIWMAPFGPTYGVEPGRFMYDTFEEYINVNNDDVYGSDYLGSEMTSGSSGLNRKSLITKVKATVTKGL